MRCFYNSKRGQTWSFDLVIAVLLFIIVMGLFYGFMARDSAIKRSDLKLSSNNLVYKLNCDYSDSSEYCILESGNLNEDKLVVLYQSDYENLKNILKMDDDFCIYLRDTNGNLIPINNITGAGSDTLSLTENYKCGQNITGG